MVENKEALDLLYEVPFDESTGAPTIPTEIVNCGVNKEALADSDLKKLNHFLVEAQFIDIKPKDKLHWKIISGCYSHIKPQDIIYFSATYGLMIGLFAISCLYVQKNNLRNRLISNSTYQELKQKA